MQVFSLICWIVLIPCGLAGQQGTDPSILTLERIFDSDEFEARTPDTGDWLPDGVGYMVVEDEGTGIVIRDAPTGEVREVLASPAALTPVGADEPLRVAEVQRSAVRPVLLLRVRSGAWWLLEEGEGGLRPIGEPDGTRIQLASLSPAGDRVAYVRDRDLYVEEVASAHVTRLTWDGSDTVVNAVGDIYSGMSRRGFEWSPDGTRIAFSQFLTDSVPQYHLVNYTDSLYPSISNFSYVKPGGTLPAARLGIIDLEGGDMEWVGLPGDPRNHYVQGYSWIPGSGDLLVSQLARPPRELRLFRVDGSNGSLHELVSERDDTWLDPRPVHWLRPGEMEDVTASGPSSEFLWLSERNGWRQLFRVDAEDGDTALLTPGEFDVVSLEGVDHASGHVYFLASPGASAERYLFRVPLDGSGVMERVTPSGERGTHEYEVAPGARWAWRTHSTRDTPPVVDLIALPEHRSVRALEDNAEVARRMQELDVPPTEFFQVQIEEGVELDALVIRPAGFDPDLRYPVVVHVYGMPAGQTVLDRWRGPLHLFHQLLAQRGYVVLSVDNRGTPALKGRAWRRSIYLRHGVLPAQDQAAAVQALESRWRWMDPERTAIYGWSGGGNVSLNAILRHPDVFQVAMPGAGISDHRLYHAGFTERFLGLPSEHPDAYAETAPVRQVDNLRGDLLIIHGTGDPNVHFQNTEVLVNALIDARKRFTVAPYPNRPHGVPDRYHLHDLYLSFLEARLPPGPRPVERGSEGDW